MSEHSVKTQRAQRRILQITALPFPPEIRVVKEGRTLAEAGFQSAVLCPPMAGRPAREEWNGITIFRPPDLGGASGIVDKLFYQTLFFSPAWYRAIQQVITDYKPDVLHVHDIWLGRAAFRARTHQKIVLDLHENMPDAVVEYLKGFRGPLKLFNATFKNKPRVLLYERDLLSRSDGVLVVVDEARRRVLAAHPRLDPHTVVTVENLETKRFLQSAPNGVPGIDPTHFSILYIGGFGPHRGIETLIRAMVFIKQWGLNVRVYLVGARESQYLTMLQELIQDCNVSNFIDIQGWVSADQVLGYMKQATVGTVPHHSSPHTDNTIPHKLYQYMLTGTPVLVSSSPPLARTVRQANSGMIFAAGDDADCARVIREMVENPDRMKEFAANGTRYVLEQGHNWEDESAPALLRFYDKLFHIQ